MHINPNNKERFLMSLALENPEDAEKFQNDEIKIALKKFHDENWVDKFNKDQNVFRLDCKLLLSNLLFAVRAMIFPKDCCNEEQLSQKIFTEIERDKKIHSICHVQNFDDLAPMIHECFKLVSMEYVCGCNGDVEAEQQRIDELSSEIEECKYNIEQAKENRSDFLKMIGEFGFDEDCLRKKFEERARTDNKLADFDLAQAED